MLHCWQWRLEADGWPGLDYDEINDDDIDDYDNDYSDDDDDIDNDDNDGKKEKQIAGQD